MKRLLSVLMMMFLIGLNISFAQIKYIYDNQDGVLGYQDTTGIIYNNGSVPVIIPGMGTTIDGPDGGLVANWDTTTKELRDINDDIIFKINASNQVLNAAEDVIGWMAADGKIYGADSLYIGKGDGIDAYKLFYFFFMIQY